MPAAESRPTTPRFADRLRSARRNAGLRQHDLADRLGVRQQTVARWEAGVPPQRRFHNSLAAFLDMPVDQVVALLEHDQVRPTTTNVVVSLQRADLVDDAHDDTSGGATASGGASDLIAAFAERMKSGVPLSRSEADLFRSFGQAVGICIDD